MTALLVASLGVAACGEDPGEGDDDASTGGVSGSAGAAPGTGGVSGSSGGGVAGENSAGEGAGGSSTGGAGMGGEDSGGENSGGESGETSTGGSDTGGAGMGGAGMGIGGGAGAGGAPAAGSGGGGAGAGGMAGAAGAPAGAGGSSGSGSGACTTGAREICTTTPGAHGGCFQSMRFCVGGTWSECRAVPGEMMPGGEACNGEDEDCDGQIDEGLGVFSCGLGACRRTVPACSAGAVGVCLPGEPSVGPDACNGVDDDCDGATDEDCATCIKVSPTGDDAAAASSNGASAFLTVQAAIDFADTHRSVATRVCVAAGAECGATATFQGPAGTPLTMRNGISVLGGYESTLYTRCANATTVLAPQTSQGVLFQPAIVTPTNLDGFVIERIASTTTAAVTVDGARGVLLSNLRVENAPAATTSYGVNVIGGGEVTIQRSRITSGVGLVEAIGVRSVGSRVVLEDNCATLDPTTGRCAAACGAGPSISATSSRDNDTSSHAVLLRDSPGSRVERSAVCNTFVPPSNARVLTALRVEGSAAYLVVRANTLESWSPAFTLASVSAISMEGCRGAAPWLVDNQSLFAGGTFGEGRGRDWVHAIVALGDCHPVIDSNVQITALGNAERQANGGAIRCAGTPETPNRCVIAGNPLITSAGGSGVNYGPNMTTLSCENGCVKISRNTIIGRGGSGLETNSCVQTCWYQFTGASLSNSPAFVDRNTINGGCSNRSTGLVVGGGRPRIQNNRITARTCEMQGRSDHYSTAVSVGAGAEIDIHSNSIGSGSGMAEVVAVLVSGSGVMLRNNGLGTTTSGVGIREESANADPSIVQNNSFFTGPVYVNEGNASTYLISEMEALTDMVVGGNVYSGPLIGTPDGAPLWDFNGALRSSPPDIGPLER